MSYLFLGLLAVHIAVGAAIAALLIRLARKHGKSGLKFSVSIVVGSYLVVFWDVVPTAVVHSYLCRKEAGVTVYKDATAWITQHPLEAAEIGNVATRDFFRINDDHIGYWINNRFFIEKKTDPVPGLPVRIIEETINDAKTGDVMSERRWVASGYLGPGGGEATFSSLKGWVGLRDCFKGTQEFDEQHKALAQLRGARK